MSSGKSFAHFCIQSGVYFVGDVEFWIDISCDLHMQLEHDLLKKANEIIKKEPGVELPLLSNWVKTMLVDALKDAYVLEDLLAKVCMANSSYFYHRARLCVTDKYAQVRNTTTDFFENNHRCYGSRRVQALLCRQHVLASEKVVRRLMKQERLVAAMPRRRWYGSYLGEISPAPENLINRDHGPNSRLDR